MKKRFLLLTFLSLLTLCVSAKNTKNAYDITITIDGWKEDFCIIAHYFGSGQYLDDTLWIENSTARFQGEEPLQHGMYLIVNPQKAKLLEFFVDDEQHFSFVSDTVDLMGHMKVKGSECNRRFFEWVRFLNDVRLNGDRYKAAADSFKTIGNEVQAAHYQALFDSIGTKHDQKWDELFKSDTTLLVSRFMKAQNGVSIPKIKADGSTMSQTEQYLYLKAHYFDHLSLTDEELLFTPVYHKTLSYYLEKMIAPAPDTLIAEGKRLFEKASSNPQTKYYVAWYLTSIAESSHTMGMDGAFVYFSDHFFASGAVDEKVMPALKESIMKRADEMRSSLIGKIAPNIAAWDTARQVVQLYQTQADYTVLFFFSPSCGHCKAEAKELKKRYLEQNDDYHFEVFAVCTDSSMTELKEYMIINEIPWTVVNGTFTAGTYFRDSYDIPTTPSLFLLDRRKHIIAKNLNTENTLNYLQEFRKMSGQ